MPIPYHLLLPALLLTSPARAPSKVLQPYLLASRAHGPAPAIMIIPRACHPRFESLPRHFKASFKPL